MKPAIIYCRVSSDRQAKEGNGLSSQESVCRRYAEQQGLEVVEVFTDDFTGGGDFWRRPGITALLTFLESQKESTAVIFDDLKRFARDTMFHLRLRQEIKGRNGYPLCPNFRFEDTPEGNFIETILAAAAELERKQNRRQVLSRMKERISDGYWTFCPPIGYRYSSRRRDKILVPDSPTSHVIKQALEDFAQGKLATKSEVAAFLARRECYSKWSRGSTLVVQKVERMLRNPLYAGICEARRWKMSVPGKHEPLISMATHLKILERLDGVAKPIVVRHKDTEAFPLRGHISCAHCGRMITAAWSRGRRGGYYGYYRCLPNGCLNKRMETMEEQFTARISEATVPLEIVDLFEAILIELANDRRQIRHAAEETNKAERRRLEEELISLAEALRTAPSPTIRTIYEARIQGVEKKLHQVAALSTARQSSIQPLVEVGAHILKMPARSWLEGNLKRRKLVQNLTFGPRFEYDKNLAFTTPEFSLLYRLLEGSDGVKNHLVDSILSDYNRIEEELWRWNTLIISSEVS